jgi:hypothetical protein
MIKVHRPLFDIFRSKMVDPIGFSRFSKVSEKAGTKRIKPVSM